MLCVSYVIEAANMCWRLTLCQNMVDYENGHGFLLSPDPCLLAMVLWKSSHSSELGHVTCFSW